METSPGALGILFSPDMYQNTAHLYMCVCVQQCTGAYSVACNASFHCVCVGVCVHMCVCVVRSVPLCFASVQKGLVPTT